MSLLYRIKELAAIKKVSLAEIERKSGLSSGSITKWDKSSPKVETLQKIADYFDVTTDYLLGRTDNPRPESSGEQHELTVEEALNSVMSYDGQPLTDHDREVLTGIIEAYIEKNNKNK